MIEPALTPEVCDRLREAFQRTGYDADGVVKVLGAQAHAALGRDEPEPAARASKGAGDLGCLIRLFLLARPEPADAVAAALRPLELHDAVAAGIAVADGDLVRAALDIRPHGDDETSWWIVSDVAPTHPDHVLGVGHASLSLVRATPRLPVDTVLDVGCGNGVQALHAGLRAKRITATDVSTRALTLARGTFELNGLDVELLEGQWFEPVDGRRFDQIVCNPPFVVGPPRVDFTYRDSGLGGDAASALVTRQLPRHLEPGGTGHVLASWLHTGDQDWTDRVTGWLPAETDAWIVQRDVADPALYVGTWLRDAGIDPASDAGRAKANDWLDWFAANGVAGVGFGFITLRRIDGGTPTVVCEDMRQAYDDPLGAEAVGWLARVDWLRRNPDVLDATYRVPDTVVLELLSEPSDDGWQPNIRRLHRVDGPGWQHEVDELTASLVAGCRGALPMADLVALLAAANAQPADDLAAAAKPLVTALVQHGFLTPEGMR